jgi:hypothetical protein
VLFDPFSDGSRELGWSLFNVGWCTQALGQSSRLISRIGGDLPGHEIDAIIDALEMSREDLLDKEIIQAILYHGSLYPQKYSRARGAASHLSSA